MKVFLETEGDLSEALRWKMLQPTQSSFLQGSARFSKQLFGRESSVPNPADISKSGKKTGK